MKNNKKKGFTIVELVIVIAVIGILSAVLIPTFSNVQKNARKAAAEQEAAAAITTLIMAAEENEEISFDASENKYYIVYKDTYYFEYTGSNVKALDAKPTDLPTEATYDNTDVAELGANIKVYAVEISNEEEGA